MHITSTITEYTMHIQISDGSVVSFQKTAVAVLASAVVFLKTAIAVPASLAVFLKTAVAFLMRLCQNRQPRLRLLHTIIIQLKNGGN